MANKTEQSENAHYTMLVVMIQAQDLDAANVALTRRGMSVTRLPSIGGFLGRRNVTLLIGIPAGKEPEAMEALHDNCRQRIEFIAVPLESAPLPMPAPTPVTIGGATVFSLDVDYYEEI